MHDVFGLIGTTIVGKYRVESLLGEGGFGVVYAGRQELLDQPVAIKCLKPSYDPQADSTFLREARLLFGLAHPGIVRMYDAGEVQTAIGKVPYVVLERLEGLSLDQAVARRARGEAPPFTPSELSSMFGAVLEALAFAHAQGVVHRDIKPQNIMVSPTPGGGLTAKVLDFGMARSLLPDQRSMSSPGLTPRYAAPEQWNATYGAVSPATDLFALGLVIEEVCILTTALDGPSIAEILAAAMSSSRRSRIPQHRADIAGIAWVVDKATQVQPRERFGSAREMLQALQAALSTASPSAGPLPAGSGARISTAPLPAVPSTLKSATAPMSARPQPAPLSPYATTGAPPSIANTSRPVVFGSGAPPVPAPPGLPGLHPAPPRSTFPPPLAGTSSALSSGPPAGPPPQARVPSSSSTLAWSLVALLGGLLVLLLLGGGALLVMSRSDEPSAARVDASAPVPASAAPPRIPATVVPPTTASASPRLPVPPTTRPSAVVPPVPPSVPPSVPPPPRPSVPPPHGPAERHLVYFSGAGARGGLYPHDAEFVRTVNSGAQNLARCFLNQHLSDSWTASGKVVFRKDRSRGYSVTIRHEGADDTTLVAEQLKDCIYSDMSMWSFPSVTTEGVDGGSAYITFTAGMVWQSGKN